MDAGPTRYARAGELSIAYAVGGKMARVNEQVFLLTPTDVEVSQEEKERLQARGLYQA